MARFEIGYEEGLKKYDDAMDEAEARLIQSGLSLAERPTDRAGEFANIPTIPSDLNQSSLEELNRLLGQFTAWFDYANGQLRHAEVRRNGATSKSKFAWAKIRGLKEGTVADKDNDVRTDSRYVNVDSELLRDESLALYLIAIRDGMMRNIETVSRAIEAVRLKLSMGGRAVNAARNHDPEQVKETFRTSRRGEMPKRSATDVFKRRGR